MDRREPEESSSSQSVKIRITSIQERGNSGVLFTVALSEGSSFFMAPELLCDRDHWIAPDAPVDEMRLERLRRIDEETRCRQKSLDLLARRAHSRLELYRKLRERDFSKDVVERSCLWLQNKGFLDDLEFGRRWLESRSLRRGESRCTLEGKLRQKGLKPRDIALLLEDFSIDDEREACRKALEKLRRGSKSEEKIIETLRRKGFPFSIVKTLMDGES